MRPPRRPNASWKGKKKEHEWCYMGVLKSEGSKEFSFCDLCGKYRYDGTPITKTKYERLYKEGKVEFK